MKNRARTHRPVRLTKRSVDAAKPEDKEYILWDVDISGFGLKVMPSGHKSYVLKYRVGGGRGGEPRKPTLGVHGKMTADGARKIAQDWLADIARGIDPFAEKKSLRTARTFKSLAELYIDQYAKIHKRSWKNDRRILGKYCQVWDGRKAMGITSADVAELLGTVKTVNGPIMANRVLSCVQKVYAWAVKNPKISDIKFNPARDVERPSPEVERERVYNEKEMRALWEDFGKRGTLGTVYKLILITGQRIGEVVGMEWSEIDGSIWTIPSLRVKNKRVHVVPLSELALELIEVQRGKHDRFVFPSLTKKQAPIYPASKVAGDVKKGSKVADFRSHDLRRTMSTESTRLGFARFLVDRLLNHTEQGVGRVYDRYDYLKEKTEALDRWGRKLESILTGQKSKIISLKK